MIPQEHQVIYKAAWKLWGPDMQLDMCIEEMAELTQAILKARRNDLVFSPEVSEELADVIICIEQISTHMQKTGIWNTEVMKYKREKLARLKQRIENGCDCEIAARLLTDKVITDV